MAATNQSPNYNLLNSSKELFRKLLSDFEAFKGEPYSTYKAMDCAVTSWHLIDWVWQEYEPLDTLESLRNRFYLI